MDTHVWQAIVALAILVFGGLCAGIITLAARASRGSRELERERVRQAHEERMTLIQKGIVPLGPEAATSGESAPTSPENAAFSALGGIGGAAVVCAWLSGQAAAWYGAGAIGVAAALGVAAVYWKRQEQRAPTDAASATGSSTSRVTVDCGAPEILARRPTAAVVAAEEQTLEQRLAGTRQ